MKITACVSTVGPNLAGYYKAIAVSVHVSRSFRVTLNKSTPPPPGAEGGGITWLRTPPQGDSWPNKEERKERKERWAGASRTPRAPPSTPAGEAEGGV